MELSEVLKSKRLTCCIPYAKIGEMLRLIDETAKDDKERAISFCGDAGLSFPSTVGVETVVMPPKCPAGKEKIGDFHTHRLPEEELGEKSMEDWFSDMGEGSSVSCLGLPQIDVQEGHAVLQRTIICHTFRKDHPKYEDFRDRLFGASLDAMDCEDELTAAIESRDLTAEERAKYWEYKGRVDRLVQEGISKGIISPCVPKTADGKLHVPDVETMLAAQKET